jgi:hypothetical protein
LDDALNTLGARHDFEEWQETVSTFLINLAGATAFESGKYANMPRPPFVITENQPRQLTEFAHPKN